MATSKSQSVASFSIDTSGLKQLASTLRKADPLIKAELYKDLRAGAEMVAEEARFLSLWSTRIPGSIKVQGSGLHLQVAARGSIAPEAAPLENKGSNGLFRHPVFGHMDVWVAQTARPFLAPAVDARIDALVELVSTAVDDALIAAGFDR